MNINSMVRIYSNSLIQMAHLAQGPRNYTLHRIRNIIYVTLENFLPCSKPLKIYGFGLAYSVLGVDLIITLWCAGDIHTACSIKYRHISAYQHISSLVIKRRQSLVLPTTFLYSEKTAVVCVPKCSHKVLVIASLLPPY